MNYLIFIITVDCKNAGGQQNFVHICHTTDRAGVVYYFYLYGRKKTKVIKTTFVSTKPVVYDKKNSSRFDDLWTCT